VDSSKFDINSKISFTPSPNEFKRIWNFIIALISIILFLVVFIPFLILKMIFYILPGKLFYNFFNRTPGEDLEIDDDIDVWRTIYLKNNIKIEYLNTNAAHEFDDDRWFEVPLIKLRTFPEIDVLESEYFDPSFYIFNNCLFLIRIDKDIEVRESELITIDLNDFTISVLKVLDEHYWITFDLTSNDTLLIKCTRGDKIIELTVNEIGVMN
jgi:hypothetical protein